MTNLPTAVFVFVRDPLPVCSCLFCTNKRGQNRLLSANDEWIVRRLVDDEVGRIQWLLNAVAQMIMMMMLLGL